MRKGLMLVFLMALAVAQAQESPPPARPATKAPVAPPPDQLEPGVDTRSTPDQAPASAASPAPSASLPSPAAAAPAGASNTKPAPATPAAAGSSKSTARTPKGTDRLELETTDITGNRELPKVLYIVPWKRSDLGDLVGKPANSLVDDVLQPIDREVFLRENRYYDALKPDVTGPPAGTVPGSGDRH
ncbi:MAG TPA: hypothetical protein VNX02_13400 [Steroidobacteraceae bacterium]|jgi:hypothetical protein|nr:hypothetical protein [Steroidobacteraceae bacterium]